MPIGRLLQGSTLGTDDVEILKQALEQALRSLSLVNRDDPLTEMIAKKIIEVGATGIRDPKAIADIAV
jgi:hypothetical protein